MHYRSFSLNGTWEMAYEPVPYTDTKEPVFSGFAIENAVPGYWEDMADRFALAPFFCALKVNPEYGLQRYPIAGVAPDMALPNIMGNFFYRRSFLWELPTAPSAIHFTGVQNAASVWLNGTCLGRHEGYSTDFELPIPAQALTAGENTLVLSISNIGLTGFCGEEVSGLTNRAANQYTGGITGDVELRLYESPLRDAWVLVSEDLTHLTVRMDAARAAAVHWAVYDGSQCVKEGNATGDFQFDAQGLAPWSPESPQLYTLVLRCGEATLERQFGLRRLTAQGDQLRLNGIPCYLRGICEHCYYPDTVHPNHDLDFYRDVIRKLRALGFNFIRFHTHIPAEEYLQAADELGMLMEVESPNYVSLKEFRQIVAFCRRHTSVVMYSCGNELLLDEPFIAYLRQCAQAVHRGTDALFSPMSALRGLEYYWHEPDQEAELVHNPFTHHPRRLATVGEFSDVFNSYTIGLTSYQSLKADAGQIDSWSHLYRKPRLSHEICIHGTYTDLSLEARYAASRIGKTKMFSSLRRHLADKGLLSKAPIFFRNSSQWQRRLRKHCFEATRLCSHLAGYDFLGPIDTHWHTFGYDVGMMNEFYELKPGESVRNVRRYNAATVLLTDLGTDFVFAAGHALACGIYISHFGPIPLKNATLRIRLTARDRLLDSRTVVLDTVDNGRVSKLCDLRLQLPEESEPIAMILHAELEGNGLYAENEWELYAFPTASPDPGDLLILEDPAEEVLLDALADGNDVLLLGNTPFTSIPTSFQMALAGRTAGNLATVIADHPALGTMPHEGFCGWQFRHLLEGGNAVCFEAQDVPFDPIVEVASSHKYAIRQAMLFEFRALNGRLLVCSFRFANSDPAARWLKQQLIRYATSEHFCPAHSLSRGQLDHLLHWQVQKAAANTNLAFNQNDKAAVRKNK